MTQATKRPREDIDNPVIVVNTPDEIATSKANNISYNTHQKEKVAFNLNYLNNKKKARYESHYEFITHYQKERIIPDSLKVYLETSISNHSKEFVNNWHERLQSFSLELMPDVSTF